MTSTALLSRRFASLVAAFAVALSMSVFMPSSAMAAKVLALEVGEVTASSSNCSVTVPVKNPNRTTQTAEVGVVNSQTSESTYTVTTIKAGQTKSVVLSGLPGGTYKGFAANGAGRTFSPNEVTLVC